VFSVITKCVTRFSAHKTEDDNNHQRVKLITLFVNYLTYFTEANVGWTTTLVTKTPILMIMKRIMNYEEGILRIGKGTGN